MGTLLYMKDKDLSLLINDIARYYRDHLFTLELMWPPGEFEVVAGMFGEWLDTMPRGSEFAGTVIPSIDREALYVRVRNGARCPRGGPMELLSHRIPLEELRGSLMNLVFDGIFARIAWAFMKKTWTQVDAKATHYELSRGELPGLVRMARLKGLMDFMNELVLMEVAPCLKGYFYGPQIGALFVEEFVESLLDVEYSDESRGLEDLKERLLETLELAEEVDSYDNRCIEG